jgi:hypothetical protein
MGQADLTLELAFPFEVVGIVNRNVESPSIDRDVEGTPWQRRR